MSGCDAVLRWGENRLIRTHLTLRYGRIEQRKCRLRVETRHSKEGRYQRSSFRALLLSLRSAAQVSRICYSAARFSRTGAAATWRQ